MLHQAQTDGGAKQQTYGCNSPTATQADAPHDTHFVGVDPSEAVNPQVVKEVTDVMDTFIPGEIEAKRNCALSLSCTCPSGRPRG